MLIIYNIPNLLLDTSFGSILQYPKTTHAIKKNAENIISFVIEIDKTEQTGKIPIKNSNINLNFLLIENLYKNNKRYEKAIANMIICIIV